MNKSLKKAAEAAAEIVRVCKEMQEKSVVLQVWFCAFVNYFVKGDGEEPPRSTYPDRALNPKLNGTCELLKRLRHALGYFLPGTLPVECVTALADMTQEATRLVDMLERFHRIESLDRSTTTELDIFTYMTTRSVMRISYEHHRANLKAKFKAMKESFYANSSAYYRITSEIIGRSTVRRGPADFITYEEAMAELEARRPRPRETLPIEIVSVASEARGVLSDGVAEGTRRSQHAVSLAQAVGLLAERCRRENLGDKAITERTLRRWERGETKPMAGYTAACRDSLQGFLCWLDGYIVSCRASVQTERAFVSFNENIHGRN